MSTTDMDESGVSIDAGAPSADAGTAFAARHDEVGGPVFWIAAIVGWVIIIGGVHAGLNDHELKPAVLAKWVVSGLILHDAIWLPVLTVIGAGVALTIRRGLPTSVVWATMTSAVLTLVAWPFVRGYGRRADVPSALQRNYARGLLAYVVATWLLAIVAAIISHRRAAKRHAPSVGAHVDADGPEAGVLE